MLVPLLLLMGLPQPAHAGLPTAVAHHEATMDFLANLPGDEALHDESAYFVEAVAAAGLDPATWPEDYPALSRMEEPGRPQHFIQFLRPAHALAMAGRLNASHPVVQQVQANFRDGQFGEPHQVNDDIWSILALTKAGVDPQHPQLQGSADFILANQDHLGAWSWVVGGPGETDMTGMALEALDLVGRLGPETVQAALTFIADQTYPSGGSALVMPAAANCNSTVWAIRAQVAAGYDPSPAAWGHLESLRRPDGSYAREAGGRYDVLCTLEVATLLGLAIQSNWSLAGYGTEARAPGLPTPWLAILFVAASWPTRHGKTRALE